MRITVTLLLIAILQGVATLVIYRAGWFSYLWFLPFVLAFPVNCLALWKRDRLKNNVLLGLVSIVLALVCEYLAMLASLALWGE